MEKQVQDPKWEGKVSARLPHAKADKIWSFFQDFFNNYKWFPRVTTSYGVHGNNGEPGSVRYIAAKLNLPGKDGDDEVLTMISWAKERLISIDQDHKYLTYEIVDSNIGFHNYIGNFKVVPVEDGGGCVIEWWFSVKPVHGLTFKEWVGLYETWLPEIADEMQNAALKEK